VAGGREAECADRILLSDEAAPAVAERLRREFR
jgi:hypothetical protein